MLPEQNYMWLSLVVRQVSDKVSCVCNHGAALHFCVVCTCEYAILGPNPQVLQNPSWRCTKPKKRTGDKVTGATRKSCERHRAQIMQMTAR